MQSKHEHKISVVGCGIGGLSAAIRLACQGHEVTVFEKNSYPGGKISELTVGAYRFDKGPSLLTLPELIVELQSLSGFPEPFLFKRLDTINKYFFPDGTVVKASSSAEEFTKEVVDKLGEDAASVKRYFKRSKFFFDSTFDLFLNKSLGRPLSFFNLKTLVAILKAPALGLFTSMHKHNLKRFKNNKTVQIFDRYATYNGSNPYHAPAILNQIQHLEFELGAYAPDKGMHEITSYLHRLALHCKVKFRFNEEVEKICLENKKVQGIISNRIFYSSSIVVCNTDIHLAYNKLLPANYRPTKLLSQQKSSSAYVFMWGIRRSFPGLGVHNILFSSDYQKEFNHLFNDLNPTEDPTIYINITSKYNPADAPQGHENWFVMINVPHNSSGKNVTYKESLRINVIRKVNQILKTDIEDLIAVEKIIDPHTLEKETSSFGGSLYGNASNNAFAAFRRHHNFHPKVKGLYFVGGSVHPGGGIPLCLLGAKITSELIKSDYA